DRRRGGRRPDAAIPAKAGGLRLRSRGLEGLGGGGAGDRGQGGRADSARRTRAEARDAPGQRGGRYLRFREGGFPPGSTPPCGGGPRLGEGVRNLAYLREGRRRRFVEGGGRWTPLIASWATWRPFSGMATTTCDA